jgi:hypothetical protein
MGPTKKIKKTAALYIWVQSTIIELYEITDLFRAFRVGFKMKVIQIGSFRQQQVRV